MEGLVKVFQKKISDSVYEIVKLRNTYEFGLASYCGIYFIHVYAGLIKVNDSEIYLKKTSVSSLKEYKHNQLIASSVNKN